VEGRIEDRSAQGGVVMGIQLRGSEERRAMDSARVLPRRNGAAADQKDCFERYTPRRTASQAVPTVAQILSQSDWSSAV